MLMRTGRVAFKAHPGSVNSVADAFCALSLGEEGCDEYLKELKPA
jgi:hypothetical protein